MAFSDEPANATASCSATRAKARPPGGRSACSGSRPAVGIHCDSVRGPATTTAIAVPSPAPVEGSAFEQNSVMTVRPSADPATAQPSKGLQLPPEWLWANADRPAELPAPKSNAMFQDFLIVQALFKIKLNKILFPRF